MFAATILVCLALPTTGLAISPAALSAGATPSFGRTSGPAGPAQEDPVRLEYIAHAAFRLTSPGGTRIVIDPFNSNIWLGYSFPEGLEADALLVTHPHFDHDATYYFSNLTPVFRDAATYRIGDVAVRGVASEHYGAMDFHDRGQTPLNTMWVIETGGLRIAHLGDNRQLEELDLEALGEVDVILLNAAYFEAPAADMLQLLLRSAQPRLLIPMHYRHDDISELPRGLRPVGEYLQENRAEYFDGNTLELAPGALPEETQVVVLKPSRDIEPWPESLHQAWAAATEGAGLLADAEDEPDAPSAEEALWNGVFQYEQAMDLAPWVLDFGYGAADGLARLGEVNQAIETLDHAVARAPRADWTIRAKAHMLLGELYEQLEQLGIAREHYAYVVAQEHTLETDMRERAIARLAALR